VCKKHALSNFDKFPIDAALNNRDDLFFWTYSFHDMVNKQINEANKNKPGYTPKISPPYNEVKKMYMDALTGEGCKECSE
jgi:hypothetical protein